MKKLLCALSLLLSISSLNAVEIKNNTSKTIEFHNFMTINGRKIMIYPFSVNPGEGHMTLI